MLRSIFCALLLALLAACPPAQPSPVPPAQPPSPPGPGDEPESPSPIDPSVGETPGGGSMGDGHVDPDVPELGVIGDPCNEAGDCESGICEGQGCGEREGRCADPERMCTMDLVAYCGCDGETFRGSSGCPKQRFAYRGECRAEGAKKPDGGQCLSGTDCESGVCEGQGCGPDEPGTCAPRQRACTRDLALYCGCDGKPFRNSGSCPGQRYANRGACQ